MKLTFNKTYFILAFLIFISEVLIALYVRDNFVRPYFGDVLVVILIYCFIKSFIIIKAFPLAMFVLFFSFTIETLQFFRIIEKLGLQKSVIASTIIGTSFAWLDILSYIVGIIVVLAAERYFQKTAMVSK